MTRLERLEATLNDICRIVETTNKRMEGLLPVPTSEEIDDMEREFAMERAIREALDEEQANNETPGGVD